MKNSIKIIACVLTVATAAWIVQAQDNSNAPKPGDRPPNREGGPHGGGPDGQPPRPPMFPLAKALDLNGDGTIDAEEIAQAVQSLKTLDKNGDGKLTLDEYMPPRRPGGPGRGPGGPGADGAQGGGNRPQRPPGE